MSIFIMLTMFGSAALPAAPQPFDLSARTIIATVHAVGSQIYECKASSTDGRLAWSFREPIATLIDHGKTVGRHYAGPHWELDDGSLVQARLSETQAGSTSLDIPALKLDVISNASRGLLKTATEVYRINTQSGVLKGECQTAEDLRSVPYSADYVFAY